jgi:hypothetical protein
VRPCRSSGWFFAVAHPRFATSGTFHKGACLYVPQDDFSLNLLQIGIIPLNFDLPLHGLKPPTDLFIETYPYTADERAAIAPFCVEPFVRIFTLLRFPQAVNEDTEARFLPHIACAMEYFVRP